MKRILTIQDLTCLGKCALTVALPVISSMGVEAAVLPTALLSVHTAFNDFTFQDLSDAVCPVVSHWKREGFRFDAIYTGYLGSFAQLSLVSSLIDDFREADTLVFIDPVLGDHGSLYPGLAPNLAQMTANLCAKADVICPNLTEACLLLGRPYPGDSYDEAYIKTLLYDLSGLGAKKVIMTGISFEEGQLGAVCYDAQRAVFFQHFHPRRPQRFHGTGDVFASVCVGALTRGLSLEQAVSLALDFSFESIERSLADPDRRWYSVNFEEAIPFLVQRLQAVLNPKP